MLQLHNEEHSENVYYFVEELLKAWLIVTQKTDIVFIEKKKILHKQIGLFIKWTILR